MRATEHIDDDALALMVAGTARLGTRQEVVAHIERCDACRQLVTEAMQLADETRTIAGRYRLEGELGRGGMGMVFRAHDDVLDRIVAIKLLPGVGSVSDHGRARLVRESKAMAKVRHPNVVAVYDAGDDGEQFYIAIEHIPGLTLRRWLEQHRDASQQEIVAMFAAAARGLQAAHDVGVIHRDFKPDNVLIDADGTPKVADFGLARSDSALYDDELDHDSTSGTFVHDEGLTGTGPGLGTPGYMPPEQFGGREIDRRADVFAMCVSLWEALAGVRPFIESPFEARLDAIARRRFTIGGRGIEPRLRRVLERGLAFNRNERFATMAELVVALEAYVAPRRRRFAIAVATFALASVGALALVQARPEACGVPQDRLAAAWSTDRIAALQESVFAVSQPSEAPLVWARMRPTIEGAVAGLDQEVLGLCEAAGTLRESEVRMRRRCLAIDRAMLAYRIELATDGDLDAAHGIGIGNSPAWCTDLASTWVDRTPKDADPAAIERAEHLLGEAQALVALGRGQAARARATEAALAAEIVGDPGMLARARLQQGMMNDDPDRQIGVLEQAANEAIAIDEHSTAALALVFAGYHASEPSTYAVHARVEIDAVENATVRQHLDMREAILQGEMRIAEGDLDGASVELERALSTARAHAPSVVSDVLMLASYTTWLRGDPRRAVVQQRELVRWHEEARGPSRRRHANAQWLLAELELDIGEIEQALVSIDRAIEISAIGVDRDDAVRHELGRVEILIRKGALEDARTQLDDIAEAHVWAPNAKIELAKVDALRGLLLMLEGDAPAAALLLGEAALGFAPYPDFGLDLVEVRALHAEALRRAGRAGEAAAAMEAEIERIRRGQSRMQETARARVVLGWAQLDLGRDEDAAATFDLALAILVDPAARAWAEIGRAVAEGSVAPDRLDRARRVLEEHEHAHRHELTFLAALAAR